MTATPRAKPKHLATEYAAQFGDEEIAAAIVTVRGRARTEPVHCPQPVERYVESFHSRNGFSRARMPAGRAQEFDDKLRTLLYRYCPDDTVWLPVQARVVWGRPVAT